MKDTLPLGVFDTYDIEMGLIKRQILNKPGLSRNLKSLYNTYN